jgi:hypothetical protein
MNTSSCALLSSNVCEQDGRRRIDEMRKDETITPDQLMRPDLLSEIVLLGSGVSILVAFVMVVIAAFTSMAVH